MNGRWLREYLYWGLNRDEAGRIAFDGMLPHTGSSRRGEFNIRFGQPSTNILRAPGNTYPFAYEATPEPVTRGEPRPARPLPRRRLDAQSDQPRIRAWSTGGAAPRWDTPPSTARGPRAAGRRSHLLPFGRAARPRRAAADRIAIPTASSRKQPLNTLDYRPAMRALLTALDQWVREDVAPPASRVPSVDERHRREPRIARGAVHADSRLGLAFAPAAAPAHGFRRGPGRRPRQLSAGRERHLSRPRVVDGRGLQRRRGHPAAGRRGAACDLHGMERAPRRDGPGRAHDLGRAVVRHDAGPFRARGPSARRAAIRARPSTNATRPETITSRAFVPRRRRWCATAICSTEDVGPVVAVAGAEVGRLPGDRGLVELQRAPRAAWRRGRSRRR